ncbi:Fur family transcriptional regulator [Halanaerobacter jeridensis]|uniref:Fe2+ or Zn2+ uptake regulation protein n=1 Tax=Halanaerobacter jeridensis TaxID=706427 RepID=A0A939BNI7_9FIRM|nr:transcriptional repressor [Halanaerobacter jeridensis]MBM7555562.1 Fe2+ or Zn2+ uptake regulation protein [Halanaerobacter jeridensis]
MNAKKRRMTKQRKKILEVLKSTDCHPTADWIYEEVKEEIPNISLGTVYRNLNVLKEMGKIMELNYGSDHSRFDGVPENHYHFRCIECGKVMDLDIDVQDELEKKAENEIDGEIDYHRTEFFGYCDECK